MAEFDLAPDLHAPIFRDWGIHFMHQDEMEKAIKSFEKSIESNPEIFKSLLEHSICKLKIGRPEEALESASKCLELFPNSTEAKHVYANSLYELNRLEDALKTAYNTLYAHPNDRLGDKFIGTVQYNLEQAVCQEAGPLLRRFEYNLKKKKDDVSDVVSAEKEGTRWEEMAQKDCDVISLHEEPNEELPPLERTQKEMMKTLRHEIYYDGTVRDQIRFWETLKKHKAVNLTQTPHSGKILTEIINRNSKRMHDYEQMLYTRQPLFAKRAAEKGHTKSARMVAFYYMQQNTRREAFAQLDTVKKLAVQNFDEMLAYVETIMLNFYAIKSDAIFPRKYEFMSEIYNFIALKYLAIFQSIPPNLMDHDIDDRLVVLLHAPKTKKSTTRIEKSDTIDKFGDRSAFNDPDAIDRTPIIFSNRTKYFLKRISYTKYALEKAYLNYRLSEHYLNSGRLEEAQQFARDVLAQATKCKSNIWKFLAYLNIVRADAMKRNFARVTRNLKEMGKIAPVLSKYLEVFVHTAVRTNEDIQTLRMESRKSSRMSRMTRESSMAISRRTMSQLTLNASSSVEVNENRMTRDSSSSMPSHHTSEHNSNVSSTVEVNE